MKLHINATIGLLWILMMVAGSAFGSAYYVSPSGSDSNAGTISSPFLTIQHAITVMETSTTKTTYVRAGQYCLDGQSLTLGHTNGSGDQLDNGIQLLGYPGEAPVISGGYQVTGWTSTTTPNGVDAYTAILPFAPISASVLPVVTVNGQWFDCARTPNVVPTSRYQQGYFYVSSPINNGSGATVGFDYSGTNINSSNFDATTDWTAGVNVWTSDGWASNALQLSSVNFSTQAVSFEPYTSTMYPLASNSRYFLYGTLGSLDVPGEYYMEWNNSDPSDTTFWIIPPTGVAPSSATVVVSPVTSSDIPVIEVNGANQVRVSGFQIRDCTNEGVRIDNGDSDIISNNTISSVGIGVNLGTGATNTAICGNEVYDTASHGIFLGGDGGQSAIGNYVHDIGLINMGLCDAIYSAPVANYVGYNLIYNVPGFAITSTNSANPSPGGLVIEYNSIINSGQGNYDTGSVYLNGNTYANTDPDYVRYNSISNSGGPYANSNGTFDQLAWSFGVYLDNDQSNTQVYDNLVDTTGAGGAFAHGGTDNSITNNIFANANGYQVVLQGAPFNSNTFSDNIIYWGNDTDPLYMDYHWDTTRDAFETLQGTLADNIYWNWNNGDANYYWSTFADYFNDAGTELDSSNDFSQYPQTTEDWEADGGVPTSTEDVGSEQVNPSFLVASYSWAVSNCFELAASSPAYTSLSPAFQLLPLMDMGPQGSNPLALRLAGGGPAIWPFAVDTGYYSGSSSADTITDTITIATPNAAPSAIYDSCRYGGSFSYTMGGYAVGSVHTVRLHFSEPYYGTSRYPTGGVGSRLFNVTINGTEVLSDFDVFATAGGADRADVEQFTTKASSSGQIVIAFASASGSPDPNAMVSGIEIDPSSQQAAVQIAAGGTVDSPFVADEDYSGGSAYTTSDTINISANNAAPAQVYQKQRQGSSFTYTIPSLTAGSPHLVRLHFAELYYGISGRGGTSTGAGSRFFNVSINGVQVLTNFDVYAAAGAPDKAVVGSFPTTANSSGQIVVTFSAGAGSPDQNAILSGIEVI